MIITEASLQLRSKELDDKEKELNAKIKFVKECESKIDLLDKQIKAKTIQLEDLQKTIHKNTKKTHELNLDYEQKVRDLERSHEAFSKDIQLRELSIGETLKTHENSLKTLNKELKDIKEDIQERKKYFETQEEQIQEALDLGNRQLLELNDRCNTVKDETSKTFRQKQVIEEEVIELLQTKSNLNNLIVKLDKKHKESVYNSEQELAKINSQIRKLSAEQSDMNNRIVAKEKEIKSKEISLRAKVEEFLLDKQDFEQQKRRNQSFYDIL